MLNEHDIQDFQEPQDEGYLLAEFHSVTANGPTATRIATGFDEVQHCLCIHQDDMGSRSELDEDDMVVLDIQAQHTLYLILKNRFEPLADAR